MSDRIEFDLLLRDAEEVRCVTENPSAFFAVLKALELAGYSPLFRVFDSELDGKSCWQSVSGSQAGSMKGTKYDNYKEAA